MRARVLVTLAVAVVVALPMIGLAVPDSVRIPRVKAHPQGAPQDEALFSHWRHGSYRCYSCHPGVFPQAPLGFTHAEMNAGQFCGACHDGREAKAVNSYRCEACHVAR